MQHKFEGVSSKSQKQQQAKKKPDVQPARQTEIVEFNDSEDFNESQQGDVIEMKTKVEVRQQDQQKQASLELSQAELKGNQQQQDEATVQQTKQTVETIPSKRRVHWDEYIELPTFNQRMSEQKEQFDNELKTMKEEALKQQGDAIDKIDAVDDRLKKAKSDWTNSQQVVSNIQQTVQNSVVTMSLTVQNIEKSTMENEVNAKNRCNLIVDQIEKLHCVCVGTNHNVVILSGEVNSIKQDMTSLKQWLLKSHEQQNAKLQDENVDKDEKGDQERKAALEGKQFADQKKQEEGKLYADQEKQEEGEQIQKQKESIENIPLFSFQDYND